MSYEYLIGVRLATPDPSIELNASPYSDVIISSILDYNLRSESSPNPKCIELLSSSFGKDSFILKLKSQNELSSAGKALRIFSQSIAQSEVFQNHIKNGKVFVTFPVLQTGDEQTVIDPDKISDVEVIKALIDYVCNKSNSTSTAYKQKRAAMAQIKQIALESGIYTIE